MSITLAELRDQIRERTDKVDSDYVTDSELNNYINSSIAEFHDLVVQAYGSDYSVDIVEFTLTPGQDQYELVDIVVGSGTLKDVFYKIRAVDARLNGDDWFNIKQFNFNERNKFQNNGIWNYLGLSNVRYRLVGSKLVFSPLPDNSTDIRLWYVPKATKLIDDTDELDDVNYWSEYIITDASIKVLQKEESDTTVLQQQKINLKRRIEEVANNRDVADSESISDVYNDNDQSWWTRVRSE